MTLWADSICYIEGKKIKDKVSKTIENSLLTSLRVLQQISEENLPDSVSVGNLPRKALRSEIGTAKSLCWDRS